MSLRDKIMDKYWIEYLSHEDLINATSEYAFWRWFYDNKVRGGGAGKLEDYLKGRES